MISWSIIGHHAETRKSAHSRGNAPRDARPVGLAHAGDGACPRPHDCARDRAAVGRSAAGGTRVALSGAPSPRGSRLDRVVLGNVGEQPAGAVLPAYTGRAQAVDG